MLAPASLNCKTPSPHTSDWEVFEFLVFDQQCNECLDPKNFEFLSPLWRLPGYIGSVKWDGRKVELKKKAASTSSGGPPPSCTTSQDSTERILEQINLHLSLCLSCTWAPTREVIWEASKRLNQIQIQVFLSSSSVPCHKNMRCQELQGSNWGEVPQQEKTSLEKLWHLIVPPTECRALHFIPNAA